MSTKIEPRRNEPQQKLTQSRNVKRDENGHLLPGSVLNPGGRPKRHGKVAELAREYTEEMILILVDIARHSPNESARVAAADKILDRGYGKSAEHVTITTDRYSEMSIDELLTEAKSTAEKSN